MSYGEPFNPQLHPRTENGQFTERKVDEAHGGLSALGGAMPDAYTEIASTIKVLADSVQDGEGGVTVEGLINRLRTLVGRVPGVTAEQRGELRTHVDAVRYGSLNPLNASKLEAQVRDLSRTDFTPTIERAPILLPAQSSEQVEIWRTLTEMDSLAVPWTLAGGQMVNLLCWENETDRGRATTDGDVVIDVWTDRSGLRRFTRSLLDKGFKEDDAGGLEEQPVAFRYDRGAVRIDVLIPEGLDRQERKPTTAVTHRYGMQVVGGNRVLSRVQRVPVEVHGTDVKGFVRRPTVLGAIIIKATAATSDRNPERHMSDLGDLFEAASRDVYDVIDEATAQDRRIMRRWKSRHDTFRFAQHAQELIEELTRT